MLPTSNRSILVEEFSDSRANSQFRSNMFVEKNLPN